MTTLDEVLSEEYSPLDRPVRVGNYLLGDVIGRGRSCIVRKAVRQTDKKYFALKILNRLAGSHGALIEQQFQQEVLALTKVRHENVVTFHEHLQTRHRFYMTLDLVPGILLSQYLRRRRGLPENEARFLSSQLVNALLHMHTLNVVHRDLKPDNVIVDTTKKVTIIDFGLSATSFTLPNLTQSCGTPVYMAPEVTSKEGYGCPVDMWSLGITIVEMLHGSLPTLLIKHGRGSYKTLLKFEIFTDLPAISKDGLHFLDRLLQTDPKERLTSIQATEHSWFQIK